jgi:ABC-type amino acid transport substrate-binding protein
MFHIKTLKRSAGSAGRVAMVAGIVWLAAVRPGNTETLKLGSEGAFPPFSRVDAAGTLVGLEPDLAREMCRRMGASCEFVVMDFQALIPSLLQGKFNILISSLARTPEREQRLLFSTRVIANPFTYVVPAGSHYEFTRAGLAGRGVRIGLERGGEQVRYVQERYGDVIQYSLYDNTDEAHLDLQAGRINMLFEPKINVTIQLIDKPAGKAWKLDGGEHWVERGVADDQPHGNSWVVRKRDEILVQRMNAALTSIIADCTYTKIRRRYLDTPTLPQDLACASQSR